MEMSSANKWLPGKLAISMCALLLHRGSVSIMHEGDYALADYKLTPLPLLYLKCNLDSVETGWNVWTINLRDVWELNAILEE